MKKPRLFSRPLGAAAFSAVAACSLLALSPAAARAQAAPADQQAAPPPPASDQTIPTQEQVNPSNPNPSGNGEVLQMNPFEVSTSNADVGYYAQNTLSGSRMNTKLSDLGASITVVTKQQMQDTSSINLNDMFMYEASTLGTENYTALGSAGKGAGVGDAVQGSPQTSNEIRGIAPASITRDYFLANSNIQTDAYNIDRVDISRGPNSTLYGIGSPAGVINETIEQAVLNKDSNEISGRFGSFGDERASFNLNRALVPDKVAIAVAGLYQNSHPTGQEPEYDIQRREFAAITLHPLPKTTIRANVEFYDNPNRRANSITPTDEVTPWLDNGSPRWDPITYTATVNGVTSAPITNNLLLPAGLASGLGNFGDGSANMYLVHGQLQLWEEAELGTNFISPGTPTNAVGSVNGTGVNATPNTWGPIGFERLVGTAGNYTKFAASAPAGQVTYPLFKDPGVTNSQILPYQDINMLSPNLGEDKATTYNVEINQELFDNFFIDAGWYREDFQRISHNYLGGNAGNAIQIDPNTRLLNGAPNPYFGEPYLPMQQGDDTAQNSLNEQERIQASYILDFTKNANWTKWLGHHNLLWFYQHQDVTTQNNFYRMEVLDGHSWNTTTNIGGQGASTVGSDSERYYLSNGGAAVSFDPGEFVNSNFTYPITWYNTALNGGTWTNENTKIGPVPFLGQQNRTEQQVWSYAGSLQDYLFNDRLVVTLGQRHDFERNRTTPTNETVDPTTGMTDLDNLNYWNNWVGASGVTRQAGAVLHIFKWLSVHYNQSNNFEVSGLGYDPFGNVVQDPTGHGKDYGVAISLFDNKLTAEMNWYKADEENSREGQVTYVDRAERIDYSMFLYWAQEVATNNLGPAASATAINSFAQGIMKYPGGLNTLALVTQHQTDTQTVNANGYEFDLIYNPMPNWTMKFTADQDKAIYTNVYPLAQEYIASRLPVWQAATDPVLGPFWTTISGGNLTSEGGGSPQQWLNGTVDASGLDVELAQQGTRSPDVPEYQLNYLTNYYFTSGPLRDWSIGGALRYQTPQAIGYASAGPNPSALGAVTGLDPNEVFYSSERLHQDMWLAYHTRLPFLSRNVRMTVQLNVRDMWSPGYLLPVAVNPDGTAYAYRIVPSRQWYLTTTFDF